MNMREAADALRMSNVEATLRAAQAARRSHAAAAPDSQRLPNTEALLSMPTTRGPTLECRTPHCLHLPLHWSKQQTYHYSPAL